MTIKQHLKILKKVHNYRRFVLVNSQTNCIKYITESASGMLNYVKHNKLLDKEVAMLTIAYDGNYIYYRENKGE